MGNEYYWVNKQERAKIAETHTEDMEKRFNKEIKDCVIKSLIFGPDPVPRTMHEPVIPIMTVVDEGSVDAIINHSEGKTAVLNFASYKNPGGMFILGSRAQEESLCHESFLYNVLRNFPDYYSWNEEHKNRTLYTNRAIYSPDIIFERDGKIYPCDVITCAAPNLSWALRYQNAQALEDNKKILRDRIRFVLDIADSQGVETLILGAFGCGVFKQDAEIVANHFVSLLKTEGYSSIKKVIFAVPKGVDTYNYDSFVKVVK